MKIQIIIPAINLWNEYTKAAIESVETAMVRAAEHGIQCRILLIDNASTDATKDEAGKKVGDTFSHLRNEERWGFQKSVNVGVEDAFERGYDIALVCNNDIILHPEALWRLGEAFARDRVDQETKEPVAVGMITCMDVRGEMKEKGLPPQSISFLVAKDKEDVDEAPFPNFSAFAVSKECWDTVGEFDEVFFPAYFEDNDYHYRMRLAAMVALVHPSAMFYHFGSRTQNEALGQPLVTSPAFEKNRANYAEKWGGVPGEEKFEHPYNDPNKGITYTKQQEDFDRENPVAAE